MYLSYSPLKAEENLLRFLSSATLSRSEPEVYRWIYKELSKSILSTVRPFYARPSNRQALISTSTPEGKSNLDNASTVLEEEV
jgi:hypothetical protein